MYYLEIPKKETEKVRRELLSLNLLDHNYLLEIKNNKSYIPLKKVTKELKTKYTILKCKGIKVPKEERNLLEALKEKLTKTELESAPRAFDVIGDIAILDIPDELIKKEKIIGNALLKLNKQIKVVTKKEGIHKGEFRTRDLKVIAGEKRKETIHKENNTRLKLNAETCYFSPRLSTERRRIIDTIKPNESILVMFSGIGPYPITLARNTEAKEIIGIEINPEAHKYAQENKILNKVKNVTFYKGNVRKVIPELKKKFDRILMPLPKTANEFLPTALIAAKKGTIIHMYDFLHEDDIPDTLIAKVKAVIPNAKILKVVKCGQYSPKKIRACIDFKI